MAMEINMEHLNYAYLLLLVMMVVPQFVLIHPYLHLVIVAPLLVWIGCQRSIIEGRKEDSQVETVSRKDAMQFPLIGSAVLFTLYIVVKLIKKEYLDVLISIYFSVLGCLGLYATSQAPITALFGAGNMHRYAISLHWQRWKKREDAEPLAFSFSKFDAVLFVVCGSISLAYALTKKWYLNNVLGAAFSVQGIEMLSLGSYVIGCLLLVGLFFYDIFWVFGTEVMVAVAKGLNAPVKILFPKALGVTPVPCSMLGLGDIVIPGIFVALMLRFDASQNFVSRPYFTSNFVAYTLGLVVTVGVMHFFDSAQPALLYLVPACIGASLITAASRGEMKLLLNYSEEKTDDKKDE